VADSIEGLAEVRGNSHDIRVISKERCDDMNDDIRALVVGPVGLKPY